MSNVSTLSQPLIPVNTSVDAVVDGSTYTYTVRGPGQGQALSVTISVPGAPQASSWSVTGAWRGSMQGTNSFGPLYLTAGGSLTVTGSSVSDPGPLQVTGVQGPLGSVQPSTPTSVGPSVEVGTVDATISGTVDANITNATLDISGTVAVSEVTEVTGTVTIDANNSEVTVTEVGAAVKVATLTGSTTSFTGTLPTGSNTILLGLAERSTPTSDIGISDSAGFQIPVEWVLGGVGGTSPPTNYWLGWAVVLDPTETYTIGSINPADTMTIYASAGVRQVAVSNLPTVPPGNTGFGSVYTHDYPVTVQTVSVPEPAAGATWSYTLPYPAKVTAVVAELVSASGGSNPTLSVGPITLYWETGTLAAGTYYLKAWPGPPALAVVSQFGNILLAIPDLGVLPAGTVIAGSGQAAGDQWSNINVVLEPA